MDIAILGWGSLIWQPKHLSCLLEGPWKTDGPKLPIEFSRISDRDRLTLVLDEQGADVHTLYIKSRRYQLKNAIFDLKQRENAFQWSIGFAELEKGRHSLRINEEQVDVTNRVFDWLEKSAFDAAVWTALPSRFWKNFPADYPNHKALTRHERPTNKQAIEYLKLLQRDNKARNAKEYIRKVPKQIQTEYREEIEKELEWSCLSVA